MNPILDRTTPGVRIMLLPELNASSRAPIGLGRRIVAFTFEDAERKADKLSLQLDNHDLALFERDDLVRGSILEVSWGYPALMSPPRRVVLKKLKGFTTLTLEGRALSVQMDRIDTTRAFSNVRRSDVVRRIAKEQGFHEGFVDIDETPEVFDVINQTGQTDARFLRSLAEREGFELYVDASGLHFHRRRQDAPPTHVFTWFSDPARGDILSISVESDLGRRAGKITVKGRDPLSKSTFEHSVSNANAKRDTLAHAIEVVDPETGETSLQHRNATWVQQATSVSSSRLAEEEAQARYRKAERMSVMLSMQVVGDPTLRAKSIIEVRGITPLLSGKYYVTEAKHLISGSGYVCDLKLTRDGTGRRARKLAQELQGERNSSEMKPRGELEQLEVVDPESGSTHIEYRSR